MKPSRSTSSDAEIAWRPLLAWVLGALFFCYGYVQRVSPSVMVAELMRDFAAGAALLGHLSAFYLYAYAPIQVPVGVMMDRIGPRRLMAGATALAAAGSLIFAMSEVLAGAYLGRFLIGAGAAFSWVGVLTVISQWFPPARFALFSGITQAIGMTGAIFGQAPLSFAVAAIGWRGALAAIAAAGFGLAALIWLVVRDRPHAATASVSIAGGLAAVLRNRETWLNAVFGLAMAGPMLGFAALWAVPYLMTVYGLDRATAASMASLLFVGWAIGAPVIGFASDRIGRRRMPMIIGAAVATVTLVAILYVPGLTLPFLGALLVVHGAAGSTMVLAFASVREHNKPGTGGSAMGFVNMAVVGSGALFQPLIGLLLDLNWDGALAAGARVYSPGTYGLALSVLPVGCAIGLAASLSMKESFARQRP